MNLVGEGAARSDIRAKQFAGGRTGHERTQADQTVKRFRGASVSSGERQGISDRARQYRPVDSSVDAPYESRSVTLDTKPKHSHVKKNKRMSKKSTLVENIRSKRTRRKFGIIAVLLCLVLIAALAVGVFAFFRTTDSNLALENSNAADALVAVKDGDPYYVLCAADMDNPDTLTVEPESCGYMIVRVDTSSHSLTFVTVPSVICYKMSDNAVHPLFEARSVGGDAELVRSISGLCNIEINHFISTNSQHIENIVNMMGGMQIDVVEEIDDPNAGNEVIFAGDQLLDGSQMLTYLRATNVSGGFETTAANRVGFTMDVLRAALSSSGFDLASLVADASRYFDTDMSTSDLLREGDALRPVDDIGIFSCIVPYYETRGQSTDDVVYQISSNSWNTMRELIVSGQNPESSDESMTNVVPADVSVEVRNGTQMTGAGAKLGEILQGYGYNVIGVGNVTDATTYPETLIVFTDSKYEGAAKAIANQIGSGRVINGGDYYSSEAGVIAIIGLDYMPAV